MYKDSKSCFFRVHLSFGIWTVQSNLAIPADAFRQKLFGSDAAIMLAENLIIVISSIVYDNHISK